MYKNESRCTKTLVWSILGLVFGILPALFWMFLLIGSIAIGEASLPLVVFSLFFAALGVLFTVLGIRGLSVVTAASYCSRMFDKDSDGFITMDSILSSKGSRPGSSFERRILRAVEKDYFSKLTYDRAHRMFELSDRVLYTEEFTNRFIGLNCPGCGAPLKIKHGMSAICGRCGREVRA